MSKPQPLPDDDDEWVRFRVTCDLCDRVAIWRHPEGGLRCARCPRPRANEIRTGEAS